MIRSVINKISSWWQGEWVEPTMEEIFEHDNPPDKYKHHWSASIIRASFYFWLKHWKVLFPVIAATVVALFIHFDSKATNNPNQKENSQIISSKHVSS